MQPKYLFITGGVVSSIGKGIAAASLGALLEARGLKVALLKLDPYLNVDPGTMSPFQHGEVYVTDDGAETDLDLGHYFRFTHAPLSRAASCTAGQLYDTILRRERKGDYLGQTVQVVPHLTDEIQHRILLCAQQREETDVVLVEIGGTVGDIESLPFLEAIRQFRYERPGECLNLHLTYIPYLRAAGEVKTKPTQHSVQQMRQIGLHPDILLCRAEGPVSEEVRAKISLFCNVPLSQVFQAIDVQHSLYEMPLMLHAEGVDTALCRLLHLGVDRPAVLDDWQRLVERMHQPRLPLRIAMVGKYVSHQDADKSVVEALQHAALMHGRALEVVRVEAEALDTMTATEQHLSQVDGVLIPGGFGDRGWEGKLHACRYCREQKLPYLGICLGMQVMTVEYSRSHLHLAQANSTEIDPNTPHPVITLLMGQKGLRNVGGTMRLGAYECHLQPGTHAHAAYRKASVKERHRHRWEFNGRYRAALEQAGLRIAGTTAGGELVEIVEVEDHPWMVGVQFHPEFLSRPTAPHPLFEAFLEAAITHCAGVEHA